MFKTYINKFVIFFILQSLEDLSIEKQTLVARYEKEIQTLKDKLTKQERDLTDKHKANIQDVNNKHKDIIEKHKTDAEVKLNEEKQVYI